MYSAPSSSVSLPWDQQLLELGMGLSSVLPAQRSPVDGQMQRPEWGPWLALAMRLLGTDPSPPWVMSGVLQQPSSEGCPAFPLTWLQILKHALGMLREPFSLCPRPELGARDPVLEVVVPAGAPCCCDQGCRQGASPRGSVKVSCWREGSQVRGPGGQGTTRHRPQRTDHTPTLRTLVFLLC